MIENRNLKPGTVLKATYKKKNYRCDVVTAEDGKLIYRLKNGKEFTSPSRAGTEVMGGVACNGWRFWSVAVDAEPMKSVQRTDKKKGLRNVPTLAKTRPQRGVRVQRNGQQP